MDTHNDEWGIDNVIDGLIRSERIKAASEIAALSLLASLVSDLEMELLKETGKRIRVTFTVKCVLEAE